MTNNYIKVLVRSSARTSEEGGAQGFMFFFDSADKESAEGAHKKALVCGAQFIWRPAGFSLLRRVLQGAQQLARINPVHLGKLDERFETQVEGTGFEAAQVPIVDAYRFCGFRACHAAVDAENSGVLANSPRQFSKPVCHAGILGLDGPND